jgi:hypothetical protein
MRDRLKLISTEDPYSEYGGTPIPFVVCYGRTSWEGDVPVLAYYKGQGFYVLNKGGSGRVDLITCYDLKQALDKYMFKGTKYIISTYNPTLYYLFPGVSTNDNLFKTDNEFIPTLPISDLARLEIDGFDSSSSVTQEDVRCMKACDSWFNDLTLYDEITEKIEKRVNSIFGYYKEFDATKEVREKTGEYSVDLSKDSLVVSLISDSSYTDTINLEDWVLKSKKGTYSISGKLDISYMYSIGGEMYSGMQTIKAFKYEENVTSKNVIMNFGDSCPIQIEYMDYILKIYPLEERVDEVLFTDCTLTIGVL